MDVSLALDEFACHSFTTFTVSATVMDLYLDSTLPTLLKSVEVGCVWKPKVHPDCNCHTDMLRYASPGGPCSTTCTFAHFPQLHRERDGSEWTLQVSRGDFGNADIERVTSWSAGGRVLHGTVEHRATRICLVTARIFETSFAHMLQFRAAPSEVRECDVVLVEIEAFASEPPLPESERVKYARLPVRSRRADLSAAGSSANVFWPRNARAVLRALIEQGWGTSVGVRLRLADVGSWRVEEVACLLDELLAVTQEVEEEGLDSRMTTTTAMMMMMMMMVVVDTEVAIPPPCPDAAGSPKESVFDKLYNLYGARLRLVPGLSSGALAELMEMRYRGRAIKLYFCEGDVESCLETAGRQDPGPGLPECRDATAHVPDGRCAFCLHPRSSVIIAACGRRSVPAAEAGDVRVAWRRADRCAARALQRVGDLVAVHGAFLDTDTLCNFPAKRPGCEQVTRTPGRWTVGSYERTDAYAVSISSEDVPYMDRLGVAVFGELCFRSNNRAGIIVTLPSAGYDLEPGCLGSRPFNRHERKASDSSVVFGDGQLAFQISDMAKWGVSQYALGYLDYTFGDRELPTFTKLSAYVSAATVAHATLRYRYIKTVTSGNGVYVHAHVSGLYKLESGMFFRRAEEDAPLLRSFVTVPHVPGLRLGISSDINVGAPYEDGGASELMAMFAEVVATPPPLDAASSLVEYSGGEYAVAFVSRESEKICLYRAVRSSPSPRAAARDESAATECRRAAKWDLHERTGDGGLCKRRIAGPSVRVRVELEVPLRSDAKRETCVSLKRHARHMSEGELTENEKAWLKGDSRAAGGAGLDSGTSLRTRLASDVLKCIRIPDLCFVTKDHSQTWGTADRVVAMACALPWDKEDSSLSVRMIVELGNGTACVEVPCGSSPFAFGAKPAPFRLQPYPGPFELTEPGAATKHTLRAMLTLADRSADAFVSRHCPRGPRSRLESSLSIENAVACLSYSAEMLASLERSIEKTRESFLENRLEAIGAFAAVREDYGESFALCASACALAVLIAAAVSIVLTVTSVQSTVRRWTYAKLE
ncbi:MAG: hypothetical protein AAFU38_08690 [Bacteroidota bacterium]